LHVIRVDRLTDDYFAVNSLFMLTGIFSTLLIPETKGRTLEELSNENQEGFVKAPASKKETVPAV
jgi:PHS family inorganic phosphate transporter-like MFS transporter